MIRSVMVLAMQMASAYAGGYVRGIASKLPLSTHAIAVCEPFGVIDDEGSTWLGWWQASPPGGASANLEDKGVFCSRFDRGDRVLVPPTRIAAPRDAYDAWMGFSPMPFYACATPDGGMLVLLASRRRLGEPRSTPSRSAPTGRLPYSRMGSPSSERRSVLVAYVNSVGRVGADTLDFEWEVGGAKLGHVPAAGGATRAVFERPDRVHCFISGRNQTACHAVLSLARGKVRVMQKQVVSWVLPLGTRGEHRTLPQLDWMDAEGCLATAVLARSDTLLVVRAAGARGGWPSFSLTLGDRLSVYRLQLSTLQMLDSMSVSAAALAGRFTAGVGPSRATSVRTAGGYTFCFPGSDGVVAFRLGLGGEPAYGRRDTVAVGSNEDYRGPGWQIVNFFAEGPWRPWEVRWFAVDSSGRLFREAYRADSVPGRVYYR